MVIVHHGSVMILCLS